MTAPLAVETYFFPHVAVSADPQYKEDVSAEKPEYDIKVNVEHDEKNNQYQVMLEIVSFPESEGKKQAYTVHLVVVGLFRVAPDWPDPNKLLRITGASILYSAAREFLITITARGPWGQIMLPTVSFIKDGDLPRGSEKEETEKPKRRRKTKE